MKRGVLGVEGWLDKQRFGSYIDIAPQKREEKLGEWSFS